MKTIKAKDYTINICEDTKEFVNETNKENVAMFGIYIPETDMTTYWFNKEVYNDTLKYAVVSTILTNEMINADDLETENDCHNRASIAAFDLVEILENL